MCFISRSTWGKEFPRTVSCKRFVELQRKVGVPMAIFVKMMCLGRYTGISFIDSTALRACHIRREKQYKTFNGVAQKGQCSLGWFYGFKLHLIINDKGELLDFILSPGNVDDRDPLKTWTSTNASSESYSATRATSEGISSNSFSWTAYIWSQRSKGT